MKVLQKSTFRPTAAPLSSLSFPSSGNILILSSFSPGPVKSHSWILVCSRNVSCGTLTHYFSAFLLIFSSSSDESSHGERPNIIVIVADDLGYNDVSWHNPDILSPNMDRLARFEPYFWLINIVYKYSTCFCLIREGVILEQSYVQPSCTPTRSALMTGRYPIHTGALQIGIIVKL